MPLARFSVATLLLLSAFRLLVYRLSDYLPSTVPIKDSAFFLKKYTFFLQNGWYESIVEGASPVFNSLIWGIDLFVGDVYQSMKFLSMISMVATVLVWTYFTFSVLKTSKRYVFISVTFLIYLSFYRAAFFSGTNDPLFSLLISLGIVLLFKFVIDSSVKSLYWSSIYFCLALGTREIVVFYAPGLCLIVALLVIYKKISFHQLLVFMSIFLIGTFVIYYPALVETHSFRFADKNEGVGNWPEKNYVQVLLDVPQMTFDEVELFKKNNPGIELPQTYSEAILLNPTLAWSNFFRQLTLIQKPFIWQIGVLFLLFVAAALMKIRQMDLINLNVLSCILYLLFSLSFSILVINRVEFRWFMVFPYLFSALSISVLDRYSNKYPFVELLFLANCLIISFLNFNLIGVWK